MCSYYQLELLLGIFPGEVLVDPPPTKGSEKERIQGKWTCLDSIGNMDTTIKENAKCKKILIQSIQEIQDTMRRPNLRIIVDENEDVSP